MTFEKPSNCWGALTTTRKSSPPSQHLFWPHYNCKTFWGQNSITSQYHGRKKEKSGRKSANNYFRKSSKMLEHWHDYSEKRLAESVPFFDHALTASNFGIKFQTLSKEKEKSYQTTTLGNPSKCWRALTAARKSISSSQHLFLTAR